MLGSLFNSWANKQKVREAVDFLTKIEGAESTGLGSYVALTLDRAETIFLERGVDVFEPIDAMTSDPNLLFGLSSEAVKLQSQGDLLQAGSMIIWVHTLRSIESSELKVLGRQIWSNLARGFPYAEEAAHEYWSLTGQYLSTQRLGDFPSGLEPLKR